MKSFIFCTYICFLACNGAADKQGLEDKILTILPGKMTDHQFAFVRPDTYKIYVCFLADKNMKRYPHDLAYKAVSQIKGKSNFFTRPQSPETVVTRVMRTADLIKFGPPAISLFLFFDYDSITTVPGYTGKDKTTYHTLFNNGCPRPEVLVFNSTDKEQTVKEIYSLLFSQPEVAELRRRGAVDAVEKKRTEFLEKKDFDIAVQINHQTVRKFFAGPEDECVIL